MKHRQAKKKYRQIQAARQDRRIQQRSMQGNDAARFDAYASTPNGSARLVAFHDAAVDADDTLEAVDRAIVDGDLEEARHLVALGRESLSERIAELKELL